VVKKSFKMGSTRWEIVEEESVESVKKLDTQDTRQMFVSVLTDFRH
jgi:hypothetical protein